MMKLFKKLINIPWITLILILILSFAAFMTMQSNSRMETDMDEYMPQNHPAFVYSDKAEEWFNIKDGIIIAIENKEGIYNARTLQKVKELTERLQDMEEINKDDVTSLYTADNIIGTEGGLDVTSFYDDVPTEQQKLDELRKKVKDNEMVFGKIVSENEKVTLINAEIGDDVFSQKFYQEILDLVDEYREPENLYVGGRPIVEGTMAYLGPRDMQKMVPIVLVVIVVVLLLVLRSFKSTIFTLLVVLFSTLWAFGLMAGLGIPIYAVTTMMPVMLIAIGVADGIHLYSHLHLFMNNNPEASKKEAVVDMLKGMWKPVVMTSVTTAVGFVSLLTSQVYPIKYFGLFTAFGVMMAMVFSLVLIPAALMAFGLPGWSRDEEKEEEDAEEEGIVYKMLTTLAEKVVQHKYVTIFITIIVIVLSIGGMTRVWIDSSFLSKFEDDSKIVQADRFINEHFGGTSRLNVILESDEKDTFKQPEVLRAMATVQKDLEDSLQVVGNSFGITEYLERMNRVMHADSAKYNRIPDSQNLVAQYLLLYEMSGDPDNLWQVVDYDYKKSNLSFQLKEDNSRSLNKTISLIEKHSPKFEEMGIEVNYAGSAYISLVFTDLILKGQIQSIVLALILVVILLSFMFKNIKAGLIGAVPITITAFISFGVMGLLNIPLSTTTALLSSIAIGIGIDYAVHFIERYKIYASRTKDKIKTGRKTMHHSGRAILFNAMVVIAGFLVLLFSVFPPNRTLGALVSMNMFTSLVGTLTIMFLLLYIFNVYFKEDDK